MEKNTHNSSVEKKNEWKKIVDSEELIIFEKNFNGLNIRIECRINDNEQWNVFKTYYNEKINHTEEFFAENKEKLDLLIFNLLKEKVMSYDDLVLKKKLEFKKPTIKIKREYKTDYVEKWAFSVNSEGYVNYFILCDADDSQVKLDLIIQNKYLKIEKQILDEINSIVDIPSSSHELVIENIFYYVSKSENIIKNNFLNLISNLDEDDEEDD